MQVDWKKPARRRLSLTPLVDIIFQLLLFFMLSSTFSKYATLDVNRTAAIAKAGDVPGVASPQNMRAIFVNVDARSKIRVNGQYVVLGELVNKMNEFHQSGARAVVITVRDAANVQDLVSVVERVRASKIRLVTMAN